MDLSIIILTWNSKLLLQRCLESIHRNTKSTAYEIIVIDNASQDDTVQMVRVAYPNIILVQNDKNIGLPARNQGLFLARGDCLLLLDVDTIVLENALDTLVDYLKSHPNVGLVAAKLTDTEGNIQYTCRKFPTSISKFLRRIPFRWAQRLLAEEELRDWDHTSVRMVDYVIGACQMIRREAFLKVGFIDRHIFYGPEDIDYCLRIWQAGYKVVFNPGAIIIHDEQRITKKRILSRVSFEHIKGLAYYFIKYKYLFSRDKIYKSIINQSNK